MSRGRALPYYGKLDVVNLNREVYRIWLTRDEEPELLDSELVPWQNETTELHQLMMRDMAQKLIDSLVLNEDQSAVLMHRILEERTLKEVATDLNLSVERVRQIEQHILRKLRKSFYSVTGVECYMWHNSEAAAYMLEGA